MNTELLQAIRQIIGDEKIIEIYKLTGSTPVFFSALNTIIVHQGIRKDLADGMDIDKIAEKYCYSTKQVKRILGLE